MNRATDDRSFWERINRPETLRCTSCGATETASMGALGRAGWDWYTPLVSEPVIACPRCLRTRLDEISRLMAEARYRDTVAVRAGMNVETLRLRVPADLMESYRRAAELAGQTVEEWALAVLLDEARCG